MFATKYKHLGNKIRYYRHARDLEQVVFADKVGITSQYLSKIECGYAKPSMDLLFRIAKSLDVEVYELVKEDEV